MASLGGLNNTGNTLFGNTSVQNNGNNGSLFGNNNTNNNSPSIFGNDNKNNNNNSFSLFSNNNGESQNNNNSKTLNGNNNFGLFGHNNDNNNQTSLFGQNNHCTPNNESLFNNVTESSNAKNINISLFGSPDNGMPNISQKNTTIQHINIYGNITNDNFKNLLNENNEKKSKSLSQILFDKMKENKELNYLSYNSEYMQEKQDEEEKKNINKYKNMAFEISPANNININPVLKNNVMSIKEYFNKSGNKFKKSMRLANSFDMSYNLENKVLTNLEKSFSNKISFNNALTKNNKKKIAIKCLINEPHKASFTIIVGKKVEISKLKKTICEQLGKKNKVYSSLEPDSFWLMRNYSVIQEYGTIGDTPLSDGDNIYIILKDSMKKAQLP